MIVIGSRGSALALAQARWVSGQLQQQNLQNRIQIIKTKGDLVQDRFDKMEGKGFFTSEIEAALAGGHIDLAVHSLKDLPTESPQQLTLAAIPQRENPFDVLLSSKPLDLDDQGVPNLNGKLVGTSSLRRVQCIARRFPEARFVPIRGNVPTRIGKMEKGEVDVVVLARAGLNRLGFQNPKLYDVGLMPPFMVPAPGQGALGLQTRKQDGPDLSFLHHPISADCVHGERHILNRLQGGCQLPFGVHIGPADEAFQLHLFLGSAQGKREPLCFSLRGSSPQGLVEQAMGELQTRGALAATGR